MLQIEKISIPRHIETKLRRDCAALENVMDFVREDLIGFRRPLASFFALSVPVLLSFVYLQSNWLLTYKIASSYVVITFCGLYLIGRHEWPRLIEDFERKRLDNRDFVADLSYGFARRFRLILGSAPFCVEYQGGVLILVDIGDFKTLFLTISADEDDPRWRLFQSGDLFRRNWRWTCLPVSREIIDFKTVGSKLENMPIHAQIADGETFEAINLAMGEPIDGAIIYRSFEKVKQEVERLL